jgi:CHAT domain-containing protein
LYKVIEQFENFPTLDEQIILDAYEGLISVLGMNFDNIEKVYKIIDKGVERSKDEEKHFFYHHQFRFKKYQRLEDWNKVKFHTKKIIDELSSDKNTFYIDKINLQEARLVYALAHFALEEYDETVEIAKDIYEELKNSPDPTAETALALIGNVGLKTDNEKLWESAIEELNLYVDRTYTNPSIISRELNDRILIYFELAAIVKFENHEPNRALERLERGKYRYLKTVLNKDAGVASYPEKTDEDEMFIGIEQVNSINSPMYNREDMSSYNKFNFNNLLSYQLIADNISMNLHYFNPDGYYFRLYNMESYLDSVNSSIVSLAYNKQNNHLNKSLVLEFLFNSLDIDIDSKPKITFIVDPIFQLTPFEALVDTNGNYLIENTEISYTFSSTIHSILQKRRYSKSEHKVLAIINPDYINPKKSKSLIGLVDASLLREDISRYNIADIHRSFGYTDWQKLPGAEKEGINIKAVMNTDILQKADATEDKLFELSANGGLKKYSIIHFATHALSLPELPEASSIILSKNNAEKFDGYLTPKEISRLDLQADFVNLSACETAVGKTYASEGIIGFAQAFIEAGANGVLVSLWNVNDQSTAVFMTSFYSHLSKQNTVSKALALTKREFINGDYGDEYRKPFYWAPYIYYGI